MSSIALLTGVIGAGNIEGVKQHIGYAEERTRNGWERFSDHDTLESKIEAIIATS